MKLVALALLAGCGSGGSSSTSAVDHAANIEHGLRPAVSIHGESHTVALEQRMHELHINALSIAVFQDYKVVWARAYGLADTGVPATPDTLFQAGSISKSVNALGTLEAVADGVLSLDTPINDSLTSWKLPDNELTKVTPVTLRELLSHTAGTTVHGFPGYAAGLPIPTMEQILDGKPPANSPAIRVDLAPNTQFRYSGGGVTIAQLALTERSKAPYPEILARRVLQPLGMTHSTYEQPLPAALVPHAAAGYGQDGTQVAGKRHVYPEMAAAGLWTTPTDLARFFSEIALARANRSKLVTNKIALEMTTAVKKLDPNAADTVGLGVFMYARSGVPCFGHNGADEGFQADALATLDGGNGVVIMANSDNGSRIFPEIERAVFAEYGWGHEDEVTRVALDATQRAKFVGEYSGAVGMFRIAEVDGKLVLAGPFEKPHGELVAISPTSLVGDDGGMRIELAPDGVRLVPQQGAPVVIPRGSAPLFLLEAGNADGAADLWRTQAKVDVERARLDEDRANQIGYILMREDPKHSLEVLHLVVTVFPESSNGHDSYGEVLLATGDKVHALEQYTLARDTIDADPRIAPDAKESRHKLEDTAIQRLKK